MLWILYVTAILFVWFENRCLVLPLWNRPPIFFNQAILFVVRLILTYGTIGALWFQYGFKTAAIASLFFYAINKLTFKFYFDREVRETAERLQELPPSPYADLLARTGGMGNEEEEAITIAKEMVIGNVKGGRF